MLTTKNYPKESLQLHFASSVNSLTQSQSPREIFIPVVFLTTGGLRPGDFLTVEKEETSIFQAANVATTVADMFVELYCLTRPIVVS